MSLTPDGTKYDPQDPTEIDECWIQSTDFPNLARYAADSTKSPYLDTMILAACAAVNRMCFRKFNMQTIDQIEINKGLYIGNYKTFSLNNNPVKSVTKAWFQVVDTFSEIDLTYLQLDTVSSTIKLLPTFTSYSQTSMPLYGRDLTSNIWIRYVSGYEIDQENEINEVPFEVRYATALMVDVLFAGFDIGSGIDSFSTQTYSQKNSIPDKDPAMMKITSLLKEYKVFKTY